MVVHMGNIFQLRSNGDDFYQSIERKLGLNKVNFEEIFLGKADTKQLPGHFSLFHFNVIRDFNINFFKKLETYTEPHSENVDSDICYAAGSYDRHMLVKQNHPLHIQIRNPEGRPGLRIEDRKNAWTNIHGNKNKIRYSRSGRFAQYQSLDPVLGEYDDESGYSISYAKNGRRLFLRLL